MKPIDEFFFKLYEVERYTERELIDAVSDWAKSNEWFHTDFVESLDKRVSANIKLSDKQFRALVNIVVKNNITLKEKL